MSFKKRLLYASRLSAYHFLICAVISILVATLVFYIWHPSPYHKISGGIGLFVLIIVVDLICGPLLTFIASNPLKPKLELRRDILIIALIQLIALGYGVKSVYDARPIYLAFEGDRFRLVSAADIDPAMLKQALPEYQELPISGPKLISTKLLNSSDPGYLDSLKDSLQGLHPSYKPERWEAFETQSSEVKARSKALAELLLKNESRIPSYLTQSKESLGYFPLDSYLGGDWIVVIDTETGSLADILPLDGW